MKLLGQREWKAATHGWTRRNWCKLPFAVDAGTSEIAASMLTGGNASGAAQVTRLPRDVEWRIASVTADGACDGPLIPGRSDWCP